MTWIPDWGLGFRVSGLGFRVSGLGFRIYFGSGFRRTRQESEVCSLQLTVQLGRVSFLQYEVRYYIPLGIFFIFVLIKTQEDINRVFLLRS